MIKSFIVLTNIFGLIFASFACHDGNTLNACGEMTSRCKDNFLLKIALHIL